MTIFSIYFRYLLLASVSISQICWAVVTVTPRCDDYEHRVLRDVERMLIALKSRHDEYSGSRVREFFDGNIEKVTYTCNCFELSEYPGGYYLRKFTGNNLAFILLEIPFRM